MIPTRLFAPPPPVYGSRGEFLQRVGNGFGMLALAGLLDQQGILAAEPPANPLAPRPPHFSPKAKSVIFLFMYGGPSQVDTFDHKPKLYELDGQTIPVKTFGRGGKKNEGRVVGPPVLVPVRGLRCRRWSPSPSTRRGRCRR